MDRKGRFAVSGNSLDFMFNSSRLWLAVTENSSNYVNRRHLPGPASIVPSLRAVAGWLVVLSSSASHDQLMTSNAS